MKCSLGIWARNFARLLPACLLVCFFAHIAIKGSAWPVVAAAFFASFWVLSSIADEKYEKASKGRGR